MIINADELEPTKPTVDLRGPGGNAYALMGFVKAIADRKGVDFEPIQKDMMSGDYEHLLEVVEKHFGDDIILIR